jgi:hypothetical protein
VAKLFSDIAGALSFVLRSECLELLRELDAPVEYLVLPSHAYEHKVFVPSFQRRFPQAQVFVSPQ